MTKGEAGEGIHFLDKKAIKPDFKLIKPVGHRLQGVEEILLHSRARSSYKKEGYTTSGHQILA